MSPFAVQSLFELIISYLSAQSLLSKVSTVNQQWRLISQSNNVWKFVSLDLAKLKSAYDCHRKLKEKGHSILNIQRSISRATSIDFGQSKRNERISPVKIMRLFKEARCLHLRNIQMSLHKCLLAMPKLQSISVEYLCRRHSEFKFNQITSFSLGICLSNDIGYLAFRLPNLTSFTVSVISPSALSSIPINMRKLQMFQASYNLDSLSQTGFSKLPLLELVVSSIIDVNILVNQFSQLYCLTLYQPQSSFSNLFINLLTTLFIRPRFKLIVQTSKKSFSEELVAHLNTSKVLYQLQSTSTELQFKFTTSGLLLIVKLQFSHK